MISPCQGEDFLVSSRKGEDFNSSVSIDQVQWTVFALKPLYPLSFYNSSLECVRRCGLYGQHFQVVSVSKMVRNGCVTVVLYHRVVLIHPVSYGVSHFSYIRCVAVCAFDEVLDIRRFAGEVVADDVF